MGPAGVSAIEQSASTSQPLPFIRETVRALLLATPAYQELGPADRRRMAELMVRICQTVAALIHEEIDSDQQVQQVQRAQQTEQTQAQPNATPPLAMAQSAGSEFSGVSAARVAGTTQAILNAVSFPRFVTELINGVFKAMIDSSIQQMNAFVELLNNVAASTEGFADSNLGPDRARSWLAERYPGSFEVAGDTSEEENDGWDTAPGEREPSNATLRLRPGASMPSAAALRTDLGLAENETVPTGDPEQTLVPLARRQLAQQRQQMLATMVMLGMQRIIIEGGKINAAMRFHIDTRSAAQADQGSTFDFRNTATVGGNVGMGVWGVNASMTNTIGYVSTQRSQTTEEMNTDLDLSSSVELIFRSDQVPLNRLASASQTTQILANSRNPEAEIASRERTARAGQAATSDAGRRSELQQTLAPRPAPVPPAAGNQASPGTGSQTRPAAGSQTSRGAGGRTQPAAGNQTRPAAGNQTRPAAGNQTRPAAGNQTRPAGNQTRPAAGNQTRPAAGNQTQPAGNPPA